MHLNSTFYKLYIRDTQELWLANRHIAESQCEQCERGPTVGLPPVSETEGATLNAFHD